MIFVSLRLHLGGLIPLWALSLPLSGECSLVSKWIQSMRPAEEGQGRWNPRRNWKTPVFSKALPNVYLWGRKGSTEWSHSNSNIWVSGGRKAPQPSSACQCEQLCWVPQHHLFGNPNFPPPFRCCTWQMHCPVCQATEPSGSHVKLLSLLLFFSPKCPVWAVSLRISNKFHSSFSVFGL